MPDARLTHPESTTDDSLQDARRQLFKSDHPRAIDQYIDYFGGVSDAGTIANGGDACGDAFLERLA